MGRREYNNVIRNQCKSICVGEHMWGQYKEIYKFKPMNEVFQEIITPVMKIDDRPLYYMGEGFFISYSDKLFIIENNERIEIGPEGEYALNLFYFSNKNQIKKHFNISNEFAPYKTSVFHIDYEIEIGNSKLEISNNLRRQKIRHQASQSRRYNKEAGSFDFYCNEIEFDDYRLFFFNEDRKALLEAIEYTFKEQL
ncbi:hypothetical protein [Cohnella sp. GCM10027633]|uniref:hypothetical protein n=1 Tax=unclassified Cohnella TaxID=2636738 RepID=UPI003641AD5F